MNNLKIIINIVAFLGALNINAQDAPFSQFYANPLYLNPAFAGSECGRINLNYRNQWNGIDANFITYSASYDQYFNPIQGGIGLLVMRDEAGRNTISTTSYSGMYAYKFKFNKTTFMSAGIQASYVQKALNWNGLVFGDQITARDGIVFAKSIENQPNLTKNFVDFSTGMLVYSDLLYGGIAVHHLTQPNHGFMAGSIYNLPMKITAHIGGNFPVGGQAKGVNDPLKISPNILYQQQGGSRQINLGMYANKGPLVGGLWYRFADSFIALIGVQFDFMRVGYSYDFTVSQLKNKTTSGTHEVSLSFGFGCNKGQNRHGALNCPTF